MEVLTSPTKRLSTVVLAKFKAVDRDPKLESQVLLVRDVGRVDQVCVAHRKRRKRGAAKRRGHGLDALHGLSLHRDFVERHFFLFLPRLPVESSSHEAMSVGVDQIAGNILPQGGCGRPRQAEVHGPRTPERDFRPSNDGTCLKPVARKESLRSQHAVGIEVVVAFGAATRSGGALDPLYEAVAAAEQSFVLRRERPFPLAAYVQATDLLHCPAQPPAQPGDDILQPIDEPVHMSAQCCWIDDIGVVLGPTPFGRPARHQRRAYCHCAPRVREIR